MKKIKLLSVFALSCLLLSSCVKNEYNDPTPTKNNNSGYSHQFDDRFDRDNNNWSYSSPADSAYVDILNGVLKYSYFKKAGSNTVAVNTGASFRNDFLIQTRIKSDNKMGIVFDVSPMSYGYSFIIDDMGYFAVYNEGDANNGAKALLDWQYSPAIEEGWNDLELEQVGDYWKGYINGTKVFEIQAQYVSTSKKAGFIVLGNTVGSADYLTVQY